MLQVISLLFLYRCNTTCIYKPQDDRLAVKMIYGLGEGRLINLEVMVLDFLFATR